MHDTRLALKYPTVTKTRSPNALIRRRCNFSVIYRPAISIAGIDSNFKEDVNLHIVRIATGGTYDDPGQLVGRHAAVSLRMVEREPCEQAAHFAFNLARKKGNTYGDRNYTVTSSSKHTIQKVTDGLFESVVAEVAGHHPDVTHLHRAIRCAAREDHPQAPGLRSRAGAKRVWRLLVRYGLGAGR